MLQIKLLKESSFTRKFSPTKFLGNKISELPRISLPIILLLLTRTLGEHNASQVFLKIQPVSSPPPSSETSAAVAIYPGTDKPLARPGGI